MRPELGYEVRMRILFAFLSGVFAVLALIALAIRGPNAGAGAAAIFGLAAAGFIFAATTNRWLVRVSP